MQFDLLPTLCAKIALDKGNAVDAVEELKAAALFELGVSTQSPFTWTAMYPAFVRGEAYLAVRQGREAAGEFQKILDHRGIALNQPVAALARVGLARAYVLRKEYEKAREAYEVSSDFGDMRILTFPFSCRPPLNTIACNEEH